MPAIPLDVRVINAFLGVHQGVHSVILPDVYSTGGSKNLYIDQFGRARVILGYTARNSSAITTNTGGSAVNVVGLFAYRTVAAGGDVRRLLALVDDGSDEYEAHHSTDDGSTWVFLKDYGSGSLGQLPDFAQLGDDAVLTDGVLVPQAYDGSTLSNAGATQSPTVTSSAGSAGSLSGTFRWKLVSLIGSTRQAGSAASTVLALDNEQGSLTWTADADVNVTGYELYRTTGTGVVYYHAAYIDGRTTASFTDNIPDSILLENRALQEHGDPPATGAHHVEPHQQRMWYGRTDTNPRRIWPSDIGDADSVYDDDFIDLTDAGSIGDRLQGMAGSFQESLAVFLERSIWMISGTGQRIGNILDWSRRRSNARVGAVSHRAFQTVPAGALYLDAQAEVHRTTADMIAYFTSFGDIRLFDGSNDILISPPVTKTLATLNFGSRAAVISFSDPVRGEVGWILPTGTSTIPDTAVVWNTIFGVWYIRTPQSFASILSTDFADSGEVLLAGEASRTTGGLVYQLWSGRTFNGTAIEAQWMSKTLYGLDGNKQPEIGVQRRWRWLDLVTEEAAGITFTVEWLQGMATDEASALGSQRISPATSTLCSADGSIIVTADGSEIRAINASLASGTFKVLLQDSGGDYHHGEGIRLRVSATADQNQWAIEGVAFASQRLPGRKRGMQA